MRVRYAFFLMFCFSISCITVQSQSIWNFEICAQNLVVENGKEIKPGKFRQVLPSPGNYLYCDTTISTMRITSPGYDFEFFIEESFYFKGSRYNGEYLCLLEKEKQDSVIIFAIDVLTKYCSEAPISPPKLFEADDSSSLQFKNIYQHVLENGDKLLSNFYVFYGEDFSVSIASNEKWIVLSYDYAGQSYIIHFDTERPAKSAQTSKSLDGPKTDLDPTIIDEITERLKT